MPSIDTGYVTSCFGILKILEFISLIVCWICLADIRSGYYYYFSSFRESFLLGVSVAAWIFVVIWFFFYLFMLCGNVNITNKMLFYAIIHFIWFVLLLISGALACDTAADLGKIKCKTSRCTTFTIAAAFGIISALLFLIDAIYHWQQRGIVTTSASSGTRTVTTTRTVVKTTR